MQALNLSYLNTYSKQLSRNNCFRQSNERRTNRFELENFSKSEGYCFYVKSGRFIGFSWLTLLLKMFHLNNLCPKYNGIIRSLASSRSNCNSLRKQWNIDGAFWAALPKTTIMRTWQKNSRTCSCYKHLIWMLHKHEIKRSYWILLIFFHKAKKKNKFFFENTTCNYSVLNHAG